MYSFPSTSQIRAPSERATKNGSPPTLRNARTGELTPPGMRSCERVKSSDDREFKKKRSTFNVQRSTFNAQIGEVAEAFATALDTTAATTILSVLAHRRGIQVVWSRSAKPLFAGSIPAPASRYSSGLVENGVFIPRAGSIDSLAPARLPAGLRLCRSAPAGSIPAPASIFRPVRFLGGQ